MFRDILMMKAWTDYYPNDPENKPDLQHFSHSQQYFCRKEGYFYVYDVQFITLQQTGGGGGAIFTYMIANLLVESCGFYYCRASGRGGAIHHDTQYTPGYFNKVCGYNCYTSGGDDHFCVLATIAGKGCTNRIDYSSISGSNPQNNIPDNINMARSDRSVLEHNNCSKNVCYEDPFVYLYPGQSSLIAYTVIQNCTVISTEGKIFTFDSLATHEMKKCNFIGNIGSKALIRVHGTLKLSDSCLIENNEKPMFQFFFADTHSIVTLINCTIDNTQTIEPYGEVKTESQKTPSKSFINKLTYANLCFGMNKSQFSCYCKTQNLNQLRCNMNEKRNIFMIAGY